MLTWANIVLQLAKLLNLLASLFQSKREREAGANEAILESKEATDAEIDKALAARRDQRARNADADSLRAPDPNSRD